MKDWQKRYRRGYPSVKDCQLVRKITTEIKEELMPHLKEFFANFEVHFVNVKNRYLGMYIYASYNKPIILLNFKVLKTTCQKEGLDLYCGIETTIVHELGHAIQDYHDEYMNESEAEEFARAWYWSRHLVEFWKESECSPEFSHNKVAM